MARPVRGVEWSGGPQPPKTIKIWSGLRKFLLDFALALEVSPVNTLKSSSEPPKSIIVNKNVGTGNQNMGLDFA